MDVRRYEKEMLAYMAQKHVALLDAVRNEKAISDTTKKAVLAALSEFKTIFEPSKANA